MREGKGAIFLNSALDFEGALERKFEISKSDIERSFWFLELGEVEKLRKRIREIKEKILCS